MSQSIKPKNSTPNRPPHNPDTVALAQRWAQGKTNDFTVSKRRGKPKKSK